MKKNLLIVLAVTFSGAVFSQVGINTPTPQATLHVDGAKDNPETGAPTAAQQSNDVVIRNNGYVGMGTIVPASKLDIISDNIGGSEQNDFNFRGFGSSINPGIFFRSANGTAAAPENMTNGQRIGNINFSPRANNAFQSGSAIFSNYRGDETTGLTDLQLLTSGIERARINENGDVGVGTANPVAKVDIVGDTFGVKRATGSGSWDNIWFDISNASAPSINASGAETGLQFKVGANTTGTYGDGQTLTTVATLSSNGNVGIGTTAPQNRLDLGGTNGGASVTDPIGKKLALFNNSSGTDFYGLGINTGILQFHAGSIANAAPGMVLSTAGTVGIAVTAPTNTLDINGTTRVRDIPIAAGPTVVTPVYSDASGVLNKAVSAAYGTVINNSITAAAGATQQLISGLVTSGVYKAYVFTYDNCGNIATTEYFVTNHPLNSFYGLNGQGGHTSGNGASNNPVFNQVNRFSVQTTWSYPGCQDGGNTTAFNYTLNMPSVGIINITNNGNISRNYQIILTKLN
ncbi:hypothetical protein EU348_07320 [Chryseobacterium indologenes]|uniref:Uncharacterized protein n=1 Tax=Chryseobacterium indologenes TaxID=253 RepID=A0A411DL18_CHRID|nr:hypothetical protein EU348_07320 [Chryseobacterium indologenes]